VIKLKRCRGRCKMESRIYEKKNEIRSREGIIEKISF
jgi:hypothetical protein